MRRYVEQAVGAEHLPPLLALADDVAGLGDALLTGELVLKPTHGSRACIVLDHG